MSCIWASLNLAAARHDPVAELPGHLQGLLVAAIDVHVQQAGQDLVDLVPERHRRLAAAGERVGVACQEAGAELRLALGQTGHDRSAFSLSRSSPVLAYISAQAER